MSRFYIKYLILIAFLTGCPVGAFAAPKQDTYVIGRDDILDITVWQSPDLTKSVPVLSDGTIDYPILGSLPASGLTPTDLAKNIHDKLAQGYVKEPKVNVAVKEYNSKKIMVFGEVSKPGLYKLRGEIPLLELLFMVGGANTSAKRMTVIRPPAAPATYIAPSTNLPPSTGKNSDNSSSVEIDLIALLSKGDLSQNVMIKPGDTIYVSSGTGLRYYVLGQVANPGPYEWVQDITVLEAVKQAGGVKEKGAPNRIRVRKVYNGQKEEIKVNVLDIMKGKKKDDIVIKPGDQIIVPESWV